MKDKLRELAERWKDEYSGISGSEIGTVHVTQCTCAAELLAILDAEGDDGAVDRDVLAAGVRARNIEITRQQRAGEPNNEDHALRIGIAAALATHPARSGVVSDEDVRDAQLAMTGYWRDCNDANVAGSHSEAMRAALEYFAKGERHER